MCQSTSNFLKLIRNLEQLNRNSCVVVFVIHLVRNLSRFELIIEFLKFKIIQEIHLDHVEHDDKLRELDFVGYAHYYLFKCWDQSKLENKADVTIYKQLLEIDSKLGTTQSEQLFKCVFHSLRIDLIKV